MEQQPTRNATQAQLGAEGAVQIFEYRCALEKGAPVQPEQFSRPAISVVTSGVFGFRSDRDDQLLAAGSVLLGNPGQQYEISHEHMGGDRCLIFRFEQAALDEVAGHYGRADGNRRFARSVLPTLPRIDAIRHLVERRLSEGSPAIGLEELGLTLAACALEQTAVSPRRAPLAAQSSRRARESIYAALAHLERSATEELRLTDLARLAGLSPFHFLRLFKREMGITPYQYLIMARIRRAVGLLRDTRSPVTQIAFEVGFGDLSNFINTFRREIGCSPSRFRKAQPADWAASVRARALAAGSPPQKRSRARVR
jgi:AraC-like DNA-binding protein